MEHFWPIYPDLQVQTPLELHDVERDPDSLQSQAENRFEKRKYLLKNIMTHTVANWIAIMPNFASSTFASKKIRFAFTHSS